MNIKEIFSANVRVFRQRARLSQCGLGQLSGLNRSYIGGMERCETNPGLTNVGKIAEALQVCPAQLLVKDATPGVLKLYDQVVDPQGNRRPFVDADLFVLMV